MATQRRYSIEFKRQIVQEHQGGETLHGLAKRHGISRNLVRIWAAKAEAGEFDDDLAAASILQEYVWIPGVITGMMVSGASPVYAGVINSLSSP